MSLQKTIYLLALLFFMISNWNSQAQKTEIQYLSGKDAENTVAWDFYCSGGMNSKKWTTIQVPSCWEQQKFGEYNYGHVAFKDRLKETGTYKRTFKVSKIWKSKEVKIVFEGVMTDASVKVNGILAGATHQGAFYEFKYDISKLLKYGQQNTIEVFVKKFSGDKSINMAERKADYWVFGGIFRPVYLEARPKDNIQRVAINALGDGFFETAIYTSTLKKADNIEVDIQTLDGNSVAILKSNSKGEITKVSANIKNTISWNPERPFLYQAIFKLKKANKTIHQHIERFGFRTVEVKEEDGIYVNGIKIKFKGVNRHTFNPDYARTSSKTLSIIDVKLIKEMNMNAVRMSHYPPEKHFLNVCDSLGLFVLDELSGWQRPAYNEGIGRKLLVEMIERDVNHPSIVLWDNGNEGGWNNALNNDFAKLDIQKRTVIHPIQDFKETNTRHYVDYNYLALDGYSKRKIFFPTELLHGLYDGGHGAGLEDYWLRIWNHPLAAGAFLWVFADEGIARSDRNGEIDLDGNHAPDGILGPYLQKEASFYTIKKVWSPVFIEKRNITPKFNGVFNIENRYHYTNLKACSFQIEWITYNDLGAKIVKSKENVETDLSPGQKGQLKVSLPTNWGKAHVLSVRLINKEGKELTTWTYPIQKASFIAEEKIQEASSLESDVKLTEASNSYQIKVGKMRYYFDNKNGLLSEVKRGNTIIPLKDGPIFVSKEKDVKNVSAIKNSDGSVSITTVYKQNLDSVAWTVQTNGLLKLKVAYEPKNKATYAGITFSFPEANVSGMKWMGEGPYRVWKNRAQGTNFGVWEKDYNETITGHSIFDYPEFKGYHDNVYWTEVKTKDNTGFKVYIKSNDIFLRMLTPDFSKDGRFTTVDFPNGNISFLHGISPVGTKFKEASNTGPQAAGYYFNAITYHNRKLRIDLVFDFN